MAVRIRLSPIARITLGLVSLTACLLLAVDLLFGVFPDHVDITRQERQKVSENLAVQLTALIQADDVKILRQTLQAVTRRDGDILSLAIRRFDGAVIAQAGDHAQHWIAPVDSRSTLTHVLVPVHTDKQLWGNVEISFRPIAPQALADWLRLPSVSLILVMGGAGFVIYYLYMRRVLQHLDPSSAIPERVRIAFDTLIEGVLIVDLKGQIMLANAAFRRLHPNARSDLHGRLASSLDWLTSGLAADSSQHPWTKAMRERESITGATLDILQQHGEPRKTVVNCAPILDSYAKVRGCLITFDDVTALDRANAQLRGALTELEASREQIKKQNEELKQLAGRDPLTGCLNRRAFFAGAEPLYQETKVKQGELCCIMADIDHFKSFNDRYGHATGDQVIQQAAKMLQASLRTQDLLCRYGGEEFCIVLPGVDAEQTAEIAERIRQKIEAKCGSGLRSTPGLKITMSFGVASITFGNGALLQLIDQADQALYAAKQGGRNRVHRFDQAGGQAAAAVASG